MDHVEHDLNTTLNTIIVFLKDKEYLTIDQQHWQSTEKHVTFIDILIGKNNAKEVID